MNTTLNNFDKALTVLKGHLNVKEKNNKIYE